MSGVMDQPAGDGRDYPCLVITKGRHTNLWQWFDEDQNLLMEHSAMPNETVQHQWLSNHPNYVVEGTDA